MNMLLSVLLGVLFLAGSGSHRLPQEKAMQQGIPGSGLLRTGDHMPGPGKRIPPSSGALIREIRAYALTNLSQVKTNGSFYTQIQTKLVAKVVSRPDGTFRLGLKPGRYSLLSREQDGLFANRFDGENNIFPVG